MFGKSKTKQNEQVNTGELNVTEKELERVQAERAALDPKSSDYKKLSEIIQLLQDENIKNKTIDGKVVENANKSSESAEKKADRTNKVVTSLISGALPVVGCALIPLIERENPPMSKLFGPAINSIFKHK